MEHIKQISSDTGMKIEGQDFSIESEVFKPHRDRINEKLYEGLQDLECGNFDTIVLTTKITLSVMQTAEYVGDQEFEYTKLLGSAEENLKRSKDYKTKSELETDKLELVATDNSFRLVQRAGLQAEMDLEGIEDK